MASSKEYEAARRREISNRKSESTLKKAISGPSAWESVAGKATRPPRFDLGKVENRSADETTRDVMTGKDLRATKQGK